MGAAILEQQEQQEKVAYKESFPTTVLVVPLVSLLSVIVAISGQTHSFSLLMSTHGKYQGREI